MDILLAAATGMEIQPAIDFLQHHGFRYRDHHWKVLVTGIGGMHTSYTLASAIHAKKPGYMIQAGIGGSFTELYKPGSLVLVREEINGDLGVEEGGVFKDIFDMNLQPSAAPYSGKALVNPYVGQWEQYQLPFVTSVSVNEVTTGTARPEQLKQKYGAAIESMEGAAFHYVALREKIPFIQMRAVSNYAGERDKTKWKMKEAVAVLNEQLIKIITDANRQAQAGIL